MGIPWVVNQPVGEIKPPRVLCRLEMWGSGWKVEGLVRAFWRLAIPVLKFKRAGLIGADGNRLHKAVSPTSTICMAVLNIINRFI